jgi:two-component system CheB/CheR fusion protein
MREDSRSEEAELEARRVARVADLARTTEALRREAAELHRRSGEIRQHLTAFQERAYADRSFRIAALNLMEDAEEARRRRNVEVSERERVEESLRQSEERLKAALLAGRMATWDWDPQTDQLTSSVTINSLLGLLPGNTVQTSVERFRLVHPQDLERQRATVEAAVREGHGWHSEFRIVRPFDRKVIWVEERAHAMRDADTRKLLMAGVVWDITERKQAEEALARSEERLRLVVENAHEYAIFSTDLERKVTTWNSGAEQILGYPEEDIIGRSADLIFTEEDRAGGACEREAGAALKGRAADERWHVRKDGSRFWGSGVLMPMRSPSGEMVGFVKILRDETEAKRVAEALKRSRAELELALKEAEQARQEAERANRTKDNFLAALSHELRTPLTPVLMAAESLLRRKDLPARAREGLEMICRNVEIETHFIDDLLDITRISHGKLELEREPVDLHEVIRHALEISRPDIDCRQQALTVKLEADASRATGDLARLQQVFWNLLKNASKFTEGRGEIRVTSRSDGPDWIVIEIADTGRGIDPNRLADIFEAFKQEDKSVTRQFGGLGLGLAIAKATVAGHGGNISAASAGRGRGSTFTVRLPLARVGWGDGDQKNT